MSSHIENQTTIGVELEFLVACTPPESTSVQTSWEDNRWPREPNRGAHDDYLDSVSMLEICKLMAKQNLPVACLLNDTQPQNPLMTTNEGVLVCETRTSDDRFEINSIPWNDGDVNAESIPNYRVWNIQADNGRNHLPLCFTTWNFDIEASLESRLGYPALEMKTPIMTQPGQQKDLLDLVELLRNNFKISINPDCGMHIHAGYQSDSLRPCEDQELYRAKKVAAVVYLIEKPVILALCHPDRKHATQLKPISDVSVLAEDVAWSWEYPPTALVYDENLGKGFIHSVGKFRSELEKRCPEEASAFRFLELLFAKGDKGYKGLMTGLQDQFGRRTSLALSLDTKTIEFRYFESTFDGSMMNFWIEFVQQIFSICSQREDLFQYKFEKLYEMATRQDWDKPSWETWLTELGLSQYEGTCARYLEMCKGAHLDESVVLPKSQM